MIEKWLVSGLVCAGVSVLPCAAGVAGGETALERAQSQFPVRDDGPIEFALHVDPDNPSRAGSEIHLVLKFHNRSDRALVVPADIGALTGVGSVSVFDADGAFVDCLCSTLWPIAIADQGPCPTANVPSFQPRELAPGAVLREPITVDARSLTPGKYIARFSYLAGGFLGRHANCPQVSPDGVPYGPLGSPPLHLILW